MARSSTTRKAKIESGQPRVIKDKFLEEREESIKAKPLVPMNAKQREYIRLLQEKSCVIATGYAGRLFRTYEGDS